MSKTYTPREGSVPYLVLEYLITHPTERLSLDQLEAKFNLPRKQSHSLLGSAVQAGCLVRATDDDEEICYELGKNPPGVAITPNPARHPSLTSWAGAVPAAPWAGAGVGGTAKKKKTRAAPFITDLSQIKITSGVPLPVPRGQSGTGLSALFVKMKPGEHCQLPLAARSALSVAMTKFKKSGRGEMAVRKLDGTLGLWRVK